MTETPQSYFKIIPFNLHLQNSWASSNYTRRVFAHERNRMESRRASTVRNHFEKRPSSLDAQGDNGVVFSPIWSVCASLPTSVFSSVFPCSLSTDMTTSDWILDQDRDGGMNYLSVCASQIFIEVRYVLCSLIICWGFQFDSQEGHST